MAGFGIFIFIYFQFVVSILNIKLIRKWLRQFHHLTNKLMWDLKFKMIKFL